MNLYRPELGRWRSGNRSTSDLGQAAWQPCEAGTSVPLPTKLAGFEARYRPAHAWAVYHSSSRQPSITSTEIYRVNSLRQETLAAEPKRLRLPSIDAPFRYSKRGSDFSA